MIRHAGGLPPAVIALAIAVVGLAILGLLVSTIRLASLLSPSFLPTTLAAITMSAITMATDVENASTADTVPLTENNSRIVARHPHPSRAGQAAARHETLMALRVVNCLSQLPLRI